MTASELKLALAIAQDRSIDLSKVDDSILFGCACPDFQPVQVSLKTVAKQMRWQCQMLNGQWDERQFNEDKSAWLSKKIQITDLTIPELRQWLVAFVQNRLAELERQAA